MYLDVCALNGWARLHILFRRDGAPMNDVQQRKAAKEFAAYWKDKGYEKGESQKFWLSLLSDVFGVPNVAQFIEFEDQVHLDHTSFIDGYIPSTKVLIEQKGLGKDLNKPIKQSDGSLLTPFQQAKRYITELPLSKHPRWVITCNFGEFYVYDRLYVGFCIVCRFCRSGAVPAFLKVELFIISSYNENCRRHLQNWRAEWSYRKAIRFSSYRISRITSFKKTYIICMLLQVSLIYVLTFGFSFLQIKPSIHFKRYKMLCF